MYLGRIFGELDPNDPTHSIITDIDHAPKTRGKVSYIANFEIVTPTHPEQRSGLMIHQVPNRGNNAINTTLLWYRVRPMCRVVGRATFWHNARRPRRSRIPALT